MKERENYMLCCDCGFAVKKSTMFIKKYQNTGICLCEKCAMELCTEIADYGLSRGFEIIKRGDNKEDLPTVALDLIDRLQAKIESLRVENAIILKQALAENKTTATAINTECEQHRRTAEYIKRLKTENERLEKELKVQGERLKGEREQKYEQIDIIAKLKDQLITANEADGSENMQSIPSMSSTEELVFEKGAEIPDKEVKK